MNHVLMPAAESPPSDAHASRQAGQGHFRSGSSDSQLAERRSKELVKTAQPAARFAWEKALREEPKVGGLTPATVAVALTLATFATAVTGGGARPSQKTLSVGSGVSRARVSDALARLSDLGWIERTGKAALGVGVYRLTVPVTAAAVCR